MTGFYSLQKIILDLVDCSFKLGNSTKGVDENLAESETRKQDSNGASKKTKQGYLSCWKHETKTLESPVFPACALCCSLGFCFHSIGLLCPAKRLIILPRAASYFIEFFVQPQQRRCAKNFMKYNSLKRSQFVPYSNYKECIKHLPLHFLFWFLKAFCTASVDW